MCTKSFFRCFCAFVAALVLCLALCVSALADSVLSGNLIFYWAYSSSASSWAFNPGVNFSSGSSYTISVPSSYGASSIAWSRLARASGSSAPSINDEGTYGIYVSGFYSSVDGARQNHAPSRSDFSLGLQSSLSGVSSLYPVQSVQLFSPSSSANSLSDGVTVIARFTQSNADRMLNPVLYNGSLSAPSWTFDTVSGVFTNNVAWNCTNAQIVSTSSSAELDALESMASEIANQSQILSQFYGDIVAVCNQIYQRLGDLQAAQEEANRLFSNVISLLNTTNGKLEAINMAMSTYFELLINQLKQEGIDTRTAIADAEARLELYLKPMIDYFNELEEQTGESASTLPQHKTDIDGFNNEGFGIEADGQTGLTAILPIFTAFSFILSVLGIFVGLGVLKIIIKKGLS